MNAALELMRIVEARGGRFIMEGSEIFIEPEEAALPLVESLRARKFEIRALLLEGRPEQQADPESDGDSLPGEWMLERLVFRDLCFGGIAALHLDLARWSACHARPVPASRRGFERALQAEGFAVSMDGLVYGLVLREDIEAHDRFEGTSRVARAKRRAVRRRKP